jgi:glucuronoarabinoxylan endo-1,4-beta-xylanase
MAGVAGLALAAGASPAAPIEIRVDPAVRHQTIDGFGASVMGWRASMDRFYYDDAFVDYAANTLGQSVFRVQMWDGISPTEIEDWRDISHKDFVWTGGARRGKVNVDFAKKLHAANPEVKIIGAVWSPPVWMKKSAKRPGTKAGFLLNPERDYDHDNHLREDRYLHFAKWVVEWARAMEAQGTPFYAISLQNEPLFTQWYESMLYTPEEYAKVVKITGEMFESEGVRKPLFFGPEDMSMANYDDEVRHRPFIDALMQPDVARYFDVFATHGYTDGVRGDGSLPPVRYAKSVEQFGRPYWITEGGTGAHTWPDALTKGVAIGLHVALAQANVSLICGWQLSSEPGRASSHEFMDGDKPTPKTYAAMHYWRHVRPGAVRVEAPESPAEAIRVSAFVHDTRKESVVVLLNLGDSERSVRVVGAANGSNPWQGYQTTGSQNHGGVADLNAESDGSVTLTLPAYSLTTLVAKQEPAAK